MRAGIILHPARGGRKALDAMLPESGAREGALRRSRSKQGRPRVPGSSGLLMMTTSRSQPARSRLGFYSCYVYSPRGEDEVSRGSRLLCARVKAGNRRWLRRYVAAVRDHRIMQACVQGLSCAGSVLVPIPPSDSSTPTALWPSHLLALALCNAGLAASVWIGIRRRRSIARSSQAWRWERPSVFEHYRSLALERPTSSPMQVLLIDDVVTKGRTLMAAA